MKVKCPICDRLIALSIMAKNTKGESIMVWHLAHDSWTVGGLAADSYQCAGSNLSLIDATEEYQHILFLQSHS